MTQNGNAKLKMLYLRQILEQETDADHGLSMTQIVERLADMGISAERKGLYRDIQTLREFGIDIRTYQRCPVEYAIARRDFSLSELMLLVDAVESCKFLTERKSKMLITNIKLLASDRQRALLDRHIHVEGRISSKNEDVFGYIDQIHEALRRRTKIEFMYYRYDLSGMRQPTHDGKPHIVTPVLISFSDGYYYLTAWNDKHESMTEFRIDRMGHLKVTDEQGARNDQISRYTYERDDHEYFGRFDGERMTVTLLLDASKVEIVIDRFGSNAQISQYDDDTARAIVKVRKSEQFFGWIAGMGGAVRIFKPESLHEEYREYLLKLASE